MNAANSTDQQRAAVIRKVQEAYAAYGTTLRKAAAESDKLRSSQAKELEEKEKLLSIAGQENAKQNAELLESYSSQMKEFLSPQAYYEITNAIATYRTVLASTAATEDERYEALKGINQVYEDYVRSLKNAKLAQTAAEKGIHSFTDLMSQMRRQIELTTQSVSFWLRMFRRAFTILKEGFENYSSYVEAINFLKKCFREMLQMKCTHLQNDKQWCLVLTTQQYILRQQCSTRSQILWDLQQKRQHYYPRI